MGVGSLSREKCNSGAGFPNGWGGKWLGEAWGGKDKDRDSGLRPERRSEGGRRDGRGVFGQDSAKGARKRRVGVSGGRRLD